MDRTSIACYKRPVCNVSGSQLQPGQTVAGYRVEALIGRGGMGAVYRAQGARNGAEGRRPLEG